MPIYLIDFAKKDTAQKSKKTRMLWWPKKENKRSGQHNLEFHFQIVNLV